MQRCSVDIIGNESQSDTRVDNCQDMFIIHESRKVVLEVKDFDNSAG